MNENAGISGDDYKSLLNHQGKVFGSVFTSTLALMVDDLQKQLGSYLKDAKALLIDIYLNEEISLIEINEFIINIQDSTNENSEIVFSLNTVDTENKDEILFKVLLSGLEHI